MLGKKAAQKRRNQTEGQHPKDLNEDQDDEAQAADGNARPPNQQNLGDRVEGLKSAINTSKMNSCLTQLDSDTLIGMWERYEGAADEQEALLAKQLEGLGSETLEKVRRQKTKQNLKTFTIQYYKLTPDYHSKNICTTLLKNHGPRNRSFACPTDFILRMKTSRVSFSPPRRSF